MQIRTRTCLKVDDQKKVSPLRQPARDGCVCTMLQMYETFFVSVISFAPIAVIHEQPVQL